MKNRRAVAALAVVTVALALCNVRLEALAQNKRHAVRRNSTSIEHAHESTGLFSYMTVERAMMAVCTERSNDPLGSAPIDVMQARPSMDIDDPEVVAGAERAQRLLPLAKKYAVASLRSLASEYGIPAWRINAAAARMQAVTHVEPDMDLRDNAIVYSDDAHTIYFGTIFLVGLPSDEGMISVLAHELTHLGDGPRDLLHPLFDLLGKRASALTGLEITGRRPEELTCDVVGARAVRSFIERAPSIDPLSRRLARGVEHNCVTEDETDEYHLSPRSTLRAVFAVNPTLARSIIGGTIEDTGSAPVKRYQPSRVSTSPSQAAGAHPHHRLR
ncbi:MAG TPA: hypothetical protein VK619_11255 [Pyrinomonadaceae bacterium]|nr:hypothetical protein [Pyrinomonadaceae bacterium]